MSDLIRAPKSLPASADLSTKQYYFMDIDTNGQLALPTTGDLAIGVLQDKPNAQGQPGAVCNPGDITEVVLGGTVNKGNYVSTNGSGKAVVSTSGAQILGQALETANVNERIRIIYQPMGKL